MQLRMAFGWLLCITEHFRGSLSWDPKIWLQGIETVSRPVTRGYEGCGVVAVPGTPEHQYSSPPVPTIRFGHPHRRIHFGLGGGATADNTSIGGRWSPEESQQHINALELKAAYLAIQAFTRNRKLPPANIHLRIDNTTAVAYINKRGGGGTHSPSLSAIALELWSHVLKIRSWVTATHIPGILDADTASRQFNPRVEWTLDSQIFQKIVDQFYLPEVDLFASRLTHQVESYVSRFPDPEAIAVDTFLKDWSRWKSFIHPPVNLLLRDPGRGSISHGNSTELAQRALVPTVSTDVGGLPPAASNVEVSAIPPIRPPGPPSSVGNPQPGGMASIWRRFETAGFSPDVIEILLSSWSESTKKRHAGPWKAWAEWCTMHGWCPFSAPVTAVLSFLASLLKEKDLEYRTIAVYRPAISQTHDPIDSVPLGELPIVSKFMKGIFRAKPPKPKYCSSWNVAKVLDFLRNQEPLDKNPVKMLTFKLTSLLALTTSARAHELAALDFDFSLVKEEAWEFTIPEHVKNSRPRHPPRKFYLPSFPQDNTICVVRTLSV